jgi:hypothetical protein
MLDKGGGTIYQDSFATTAKQDLIVSAYKPSSKIEESAGISSERADNAWVFAREHLANLPVDFVQNSVGYMMPERQGGRIYDRLVALHVQRRAAVPVGLPEFLEGLTQRFPERDGMFFLPEQVAEYDRQRTAVSEFKQLELFVNDEASAIRWVRQQLQAKPQTFQELQPVFLREARSWAKHERATELQEILEQNFLRYSGTGPVPSQIRSYLHNTYRDMHNLDKTNSRLTEKARDRWYIPDPSKQAEREKIRERELLKEFEDYRTTRKKLVQFRTEAVRAGFKAAYDKQDYGTIVDVAHKLPESVLQEDEKLLMYYDVASMRLGD